MFWAVFPASTFVLYTSTIIHSFLFFLLCAALDDKSNI
jgi:hypothetical protein